jgi:hypothetical protein
MCIHTGITETREGASGDTLAYWEARAELSLNHPTMPFAGKTRHTEPSEPKNNISAGEKDSRGIMCKEGSEGSEELKAETGYSEDFG